MKKTGILMPVSALPSTTGVGELGRASYQWIDIMKENGVKIWQILPLNPVGYGNSPYQPYSSCAGDELYISLDLLYDAGLLDKKPDNFRENAKSVDYTAVRAFKENYLREAFEKFLVKNGSEEPAYKDFISQEWVYTYGVFRALKLRNKGACWNEWKTEDKDWPNNRKPLTKDVEEEVRYQCFLQYIFFTQWMNVKKYANEAGIEIMGDVPFYVGLDSVDVWSGKENFLLDTDGRPVFIAGVPPDYFSATGQRWGNPIYDWEYLKKNGYKFWVDRIGYSNKLFDIIRIDHFRAFDTFWKIPASCPTAVDGEWIEAPGYEVIDTLNKEIPDVNLVAEDLGNLRPEVLELKDHYHLKGMRILLFSIDTNGKYARDISKDIENIIFYTGTHDNDTLMQWYKGLTVATKRKVREFLKKQCIKSGSIKDRLLTYVLNSKAEYAIIPLADIIGLGKEGHINTPGTVGSPNWEWHMTDFKKAVEELARYKKLIINR
ncbi:MAG: 4-alpha-glucanotransferase [Lachnoanaerobaculum saburreum]